MDAMVNGVMVNGVIDCGGRRWAFYPVAASHRVSCCVRQEAGRMEQCSSFAHTSVEEL